MIGMPGAGKSTVGVILAKQTGRDFIDTDVLIQVDEDRTLQEILEQDGYMGLRAVEERVLLSLECRDCVIATGGSAVYSDDAMCHLSRNGTVVFLDIDLPTVRRRITNIATRGIARAPDQTLTDLFKERRDLYTKYADVTIPCNDLGQEQVAAEIVRVLRDTSAEL